MLTSYQYAEACEWIYRDTRDAKFLTMLLDWAKKYQLINPTQAWAYAMQYDYEKPGAERNRSLAMTLYLDPASPRIRTASATETEAARAWLKKNNPFDSKSDTGGPKSQISAMN